MKSGRISGHFGSRENGQGANNSEENDGAPTLPRSISHGMGDTAQSPTVSLSWQSPGPLRPPEPKVTFARAAVAISPTEYGSYLLRQAPPAYALHRAWVEASPSLSRPADASLPPALAHRRCLRLSYEGLLSRTFI